MMTVFSWLYLLILLLNPFHLHSLSYSFSPWNNSHSHPRCHPEESAALLNFKKSFPTLNATSIIVGPNTTLSWEIGRDCCGWSGVTCDNVTSRVVGLHLQGGGLRGIFRSNNSLFSLAHLRSLDLSYNSFQRSAIPAEFGQFQSMTHLVLSASGFAGQVPKELAYLSKLITLDLSGSLGLGIETSSLRKIVSNLTSLEKLYLRSVDLSNAFPNSFMNLSTSLKNLVLSDCRLKGQFPENVFHLPNLEILLLDYNPHLDGSFPKYNWTSPLQVLELSNTGFLINLPFLTQNLKYVNVLSLNNCKFMRSSLSFLGNLTRLTRLSINSNYFGGQIPWDSLNLEKLVFLDLSNNNFEGQLPDLCTNSTKKSFLCESPTRRALVPLPSKLQALWLNDNLFSGKIPSWLYSLPSLQALSLAHNRLTGEIGQFKYNNLIILLLNSNKLQGEIPSSIFRQENIFWLDLSSNNLSGFVFLKEFSRFNFLSSLGLSSNRLSLVSDNQANYTLPNTIGFLNLSSCNITEFPNSLRSLETLRELDLSNNRIQGSVPKWLWNVGKDTLYYLNISHNFLTHVGPIPWKNLQLLDVRSNSLQGPHPIPPPFMSFFSAANNQLVGEISSLICNCRALELLDFSNNSLGGTIPPCIGNFSSRLSVLDLRMNKFRGRIPTFPEGNSLRTLNLNQNGFEGLIPRSLINCQKLEVLDVGNNELTGYFPWWLESLPELKVLILRSNRFAGQIKSLDGQFAFRKLRIMDVSDNRFTGHLPEKYFENFVAMMDAHTDELEYMGELLSAGRTYYQDSVEVVMKGKHIELVKIQTLFTSIDFSGNNFVGEIPNLIGNLHSLKGLNLSHNNISGPIPSSFGDLSNLEWLDLSSNKLVGRIPWQLAAHMNQLSFLNLSVNELEGPIPNGNQFDTFNNDSYDGNPGLCGFPLSKSCRKDNELRQDQDGDAEENDRIALDLKVAMMGYASGVVMGICIGHMVLSTRSFSYWFSIKFGREPKWRKAIAPVGGRVRSYQEN